MIPGELDRRIDRVWDALVSGGLTDPFEIVEQIGYLLFLRRLDEHQTGAETRRGTGRLMDAVIFLPGERHLRWSALRQLEPQDAYPMMARQVFPFLRGLGGDGSTYSDHLAGAVFTIPSAELLGEVVALVDAFPLDDRESSGATFDHLLLRAAPLVPRSVARLMVEMTAPRAGDEIGDPRCGSGALLVAAAAYVRDHHPTELTDSAQQRHPFGSMFHGVDVRVRMRRIASMNLLLHGIAAPDVRAEPAPESCSLVLTDASADADVVAASLSLLAPGGRAAVVVPEALLSDAAHQDVRRRLLDEVTLDGLVRLPSGPILFLTRTPPADDHEVWCFDSDGDDLHDVLARWPARSTTERSRARIDRSFTVARSEIRAHGHDLGLHHYE